MRVGHGSVVGGRNAHHPKGGAPGNVFGVSLALLVAVLGLASGTHAAESKDFGICYASFMRQEIRAN